MKMIGAYLRYNILYTTNKDRHFYSDMGRFFCDRAVIKELEGPIYDDNHHHWLLMKDGTKVVGFASWSTEKHPVVNFGVIWTDSKYRQKGVAKELFRLRMEMCQEQGATTLKALANLTSRKMHLAHGWRMVTQRGKRWATFEKHINQGDDNG